MESIQNNPLLSKLSDHLTESLNNVKGELNNSNKNGDVIVNNIISQDENRNPKVKNEVVRPQERKDNQETSGYRR